MGLDFESLLDASGILFGVFGLILVYLARNVEQWPKGLCVAILTSTIARTVYEFALDAIVQAGALSEALPALRVIATMLAPIPSALVFAFFLWCCGEDCRTSMSMRVVVVLTGALIVAGICVNGTEHFNPWHVITFALILAMSAFLLFSLFRRWKRLTNLQRVMFLACFLVPTSVQIIPVELLLTSDLVHHYLEQKEDAAQQRARVAVLQMRPHFIHNTLTSIYYLCAKDPKVAQQVILDFSRYLQNNFTVIAEEGTIPFEKELEHTRAYLAVEQACHEGHLFVEFDTPVTFFRVPPLTLQPIVENAVKHGMDPDLEPLHVLVATRDTGRGVQIVVEDTGPGYVRADDDEPHVALDNICERLRSKCGGSLTIEARETGGTRATICVPHE